MDHLTKKRRSLNMSLIKSKNTKPELFLRRILRRRGYKFKVCLKDLPGKPDIVLSRHKIVIFMHGCFWHRHRKCRRSNIPKSNRAYWFSKIQRNLERDKVNTVQLQKLGWKSIVVWECQLKEDKIKKLANTLRKCIRKYSIL